MPELETKIVTPEARVLHDDLHSTFAAFRETNDERLAQLEERLGVDVVTEEKLARLDRALDETKSRLDRVQLDMARPSLAGVERADPQRREHKAAFDTYVRAGEASGLKALEAKALSAGSGVDGGYLVPQSAEREILRRMATLSPIRSIATVRRDFDADVAQGVFVRRSRGRLGSRDRWPDRRARASRLPI